MLERTKTLTIDDVILDRLATEQKQLTILWYQKMSGQVSWIDDGERDNFEREFQRLERAIRAQTFAILPE